MNYNYLVAAVHKSSRIYHNELVKTNRNENIVFAPFSIHSCLCMTRLGTVEQAQIETVIGLNIKNVYGFIFEILSNKGIRVATKLYVHKDYKIRQDFQNMLHHSFAETIESINFDDKIKAAETINTWMETKSKKQIKNIVSPSDFAYTTPSSKTGFVLLNSLYFKDYWQNKFKIEHTRSEEFYLDENQTATVQMMHTSGYFKYGEFPHLDATAVEIPFQESKQFSMLIILPNTRTGLAKLEKRLETIPSSRLKLHHTDVTVDIPKFKAEFEIKLTAKTAEFGNMLELNSEESLDVSHVIHKASIDINENGAGTHAPRLGVYTCTCSFGPMSSLKFIANRPFYYRINAFFSEMTLFQGRVCNF